MRSFSSPDLIQLPRLGGAEAVRLIADLLAAAEGHGPLPGHIERSRQRLAAARGALHDALTTTAATASNPGFRRIADQALDAAWEATFDWLSGWCKLAEEANPQRAAARALFVKIFAGSAPFTRMQYKVEWVESRTRLDTIDRDGHEATFHALGGAPFLAHLRASQRLCEKVMSREASLDTAGPSSNDGGDAQAPASESPCDVRARLADAAGALRQYLMRIVSHADPEVAGSEVLAEALMRPLVAWHQKNPSRGPESEFGTVEETRH
jgi:hypothetical protein